MVVMIGRGRLVLAVRRPVRDPAAGASRRWQKAVAAVPDGLRHVRDGGGTLVPAAEGRGHGQQAAAPRPGLRQGGAQTEGGGHHHDEESRLRDAHVRGRDERCGRAETLPRRGGHIVQVWDVMWKCRKY